jgi:tRNA1Val (adenine37-N6)-methyltransferase
LIEIGLNEEPQALSKDSLFDGRLVCRQHVKGYRFSIDAVLVAHFHPPARNAAVLDLGAGCGIIGLIMMYRWGQRIRTLTSLEIQPGLADLARQNFLSNGYAEKCQVLQENLLNIRDCLPPGAYTQVVCNPPFYKAGTGRQNTCREALLARHQVLADLEDFVRAAAFALKNGGSFVLIYPAEGLAEVARSLAANDLTMKRLQCVYSYPDQAAKARLVLVQASKQAGHGLRVMPPLYIYAAKNGSYSHEMQRMYEALPDTGAAVRPATVGETG